MSAPESGKTPEAEAEFTRKLVLGLLSTLEQKGVLTEAEVNSILRAARQGAYPAAPTPRPKSGPAHPGTRWVKPGGDVTPMDKTTPIAIPNVLRARDLTAEDQGEQQGDPPVPPVIDMSLE